MPRNYAEGPYTAMRRSDRAIEDQQWIVDMLQRTPIGVLAMVANGQPFINSNLFAYDSERHCIYMHTAHVGRTRSNVGETTPVCFSAFEMGRLLPADTAMEMSVEYAGVVAFGHATVISDHAEATRALQLVLDKYFRHLESGRDYRAIQPEELKLTAVYQITIDSWSGKRKQVADDFPNAFYYPDSRGLYE